MTSILQIAVPTPLHRTFDYVVLDGCRYEVGSRVRVPFGSRSLIGVVIGISDTSTFPIEKLKPIDAVIDEIPLLDEKLLALYHWASDYYHHPIGDVIVGTLPKKIREGGKTQLIALGDEVAPRFDVDYELTAEQSDAVSSICAAKNFQPFLLSGITGSGKTEVYLRVIAEVVKKNQQALVLVPEIALTPQTVSRFEARFSVPVLLLHSGLTDVKRFKAWMQTTHNSPCIVIGTRSAVFAPLNNCGVIVVDEEHDVSFKQQAGFRYSARDVAVMRAKILEIPVILGTATPSLESWHNAQQKKYHLLVLSKRAGNARLPDIVLHNICGEKLQQGLCKTVIAKMHQHLAQKNQILLFLNRRGYAPILLCHQCGFSMQCPHCDARLTLHDHPRKLICHHCHYQAAVPRVCPQCQQSELMMLGLGTEQLEETVTKLFPDKKIIRVDRDAIKSFKALEKALHTICSREADIIIGTQMLVKGHHFEHVTLVAAIDVDHALFSSDFRAIERLGQSLIQVAGRSGRAEKQGEVFIQTHHPDHPLLQKLFETEYSVFSNALLDERVQAQLPPIAHLMVLRAEAKDKKRAHAFLMSIKQQMQQIEVSGPFPVTMEKKAGVYRAQLLLQSSQRPLLKKVVSDFLLKWDNQKKPAGIKWMLDVDPVEV